MHNDIAPVLHHETTLLSRLDCIAADLMRDYAEQGLTVVAILQFPCQDGCPLPKARSSL